MARFLTHSLPRILKYAFSVLLVWSLLVLSSAYVMHHFNGRAGGELYSADDPKVTFEDSLYFAVVTTTTIGYGDYAPRGWFRGLSCVISIFGVIMAGILVAVITTELLDPFMILRKYTGWWFNDCAINQKDETGNSETTEFVTLFYIGRQAFHWTCSGRNLNLDGTNRHKYEGYITGVDGETAYVPYRNEPDAAEDFTSGVWVITFEDSSDSQWIRCYTYDDKWGRRDASVGIHLHWWNDRHTIRHLRSTSVDRRQEAIQELRQRTAALRPRA